MLEGNVILSSAVDKVYRGFSKLENIIPCLPNLVSWEIMGDNRVKASFRVDLEGVPIDYLSRITSTTEIWIEDLRVNSIKYSFRGRGAGISYGGYVEINIEGVSEGTKILWRAEADLGGFYRLLGRFIDIDQLIKRIVETTVKSIMSCFSEKAT